MSRFASHFLLALLAVACVPSEDSSSSAPAQTGAQPTPPPPPPPPPTPAAHSGSRLNPNRPMPSANPFALSDAAVARADGAPSRIPRVSLGEQRRLAAPAFKEDLRVGVKNPPQPPEAPQDQPPALPAPPPEVAKVAANPGAAEKAADKAVAPSGPPDSPITASYADTFDRAELGPEWNATNPGWRIAAGRLCGMGAKNHPVWLRRKLPVNARIEFDAVSISPDGDLKVEVWGDGKSFAKGNSYNDATSYLAIWGGWKNQFHVLARLDEHAQGRPEVKVSAGGDYKTRPVVPNTVYHFKLERSDGKTVRWFVDDIEIIAFTDPNPLKGEDHQHLGFNDWDVQVCFDNLQIFALSGG